MELGAMQTLVDEALTQLEEVEEALRVLQGRASRQVTLVRGDNGGLQMRYFRRSATLYEPYTVIEMTQGGAAASSGLVRRGDLITQVNGHFVSHLSVDEVRSLILGVPHTPVTLTLAPPRLSARFISGTSSGGSLNAALQYGGGSFIADSDLFVANSTPSMYDGQEKGGVQEQAVVEGGGGDGVGGDGNMYIGVGDDAVSRGGSGGGNGCDSLAEKQDDRSCATGGQGEGREGGGGGDAGGGRPPHTTGIAHGGDTGGGEGGGSWIQRR